MPARFFTQFLSFYVLVTGMDIGHVQYVITGVTGLGLFYYLGSLPYG